MCFGIMKLWLSNDFFSSHLCVRTICVRTIIFILLTYVSEAFYNSFRDHFVLCRRLCVYVSGYIYVCVYVCVCQLVCIGACTQCEYLFGYLKKAKYSCYYYPNIFRCTTLFGIQIPQWQKQKTTTALVIVQGSAASCLASRVIQEMHQSSRKKSRITRQRLLNQGLAHRVRNNEEIE